MHTVSMLFIRLTWVMSNAVWAHFEVHIVVVRKDLAQEIHTSVVSVSHRCNQTVRFSLPDSPCYLGALFPLSWMGISYLRGDRAPASCCGRMWWWWLQNTFLCPISLKPMRGLLRLCSVVDQTCGCSAFPESDDEKKRGAVMHNEPSSLPGIQACKTPSYELQGTCWKVFGYLRPGRSKTFSAGENQAAAWHRLISGCTTRHNPRL